MAFEEFKGELSFAEEIASRQKGNKSKKGIKMKTINFVLLCALSAISTSAMSVQIASSSEMEAVISPSVPPVRATEMDAGFIQTVKKIAADHDFVVQEYKGVVSGMNNKGYYFVASQDDQSWEITPAVTWDKQKIKGTTTEDFQSEISRIHQQ